MAVASIGLAIFGAGRIGAVHARNVARHIPGAHLVGIADIDPAGAMRLAVDAGTGRADDGRAFLEDPSVRGVIIATPTDSHSDLIAQAASAGKHVFCEKPISLKLAATRRAIAIAERAKIILQVGFQRRFDPEFLRARSFVEDGRLGTPRFLRLVGRDHHMPSLDYLRTSGGQYRDQMVHEFDLARWLMAPLEIDEVFAVGSTLIDRSLDQFGDVDTSVAMLRFAGGALGVIDNSREAIYGYDVRGEIQGTKGMILVGHGRLVDGVLIDSTFATPDVDSFVNRFEEAYRDELRDFVAAIRDERGPRVGPSDAFEALRIALAAERSARSGRSIKLSEVTDD